MHQRDRTKSSVKSQVALLFVAAALIAPIISYVYTFGIQITSNHQRWGEMGSAFSGIYAPILAILTLVVLLAQVRLQDRMNEHTFDQSYVQEARTDVQYYLSQLAQEFSQEFDDGSEVGQMLVATFAYSSPEDLRSSQFSQVSAELNKQKHRLMAIWSAYYSLLAGLRVNDFSPYVHNFTAAKQKAIVMLSYEGCVALDNYTWCVSQGRLKLGYEFATPLNEIQ